MPSQKDPLSVVPLRKEMRDRRLHDRFGVSWQVQPWLAPYSGG
jgi:hypothetical protein